MKTPCFAIRIVFKYRDRGTKGWDEPRGAHTQAHFSVMNVSFFSQVFTRDEVDTFILIITNEKNTNLA